MTALLDALLVDIGGTLVREAPPGTAVADLEVELLPGTLDDLLALAALLPIGAVTNTATMLEADVRSLLATAGLDSCLAAVVTSCDVGAAKPSPVPVLAALERLGVNDRGRVLFVGDDDVDAEAARAAGVPFARIGPGGLRAIIDAWVEEQVSARLPKAIQLVGPVDAAAVAAAEELQNRLTKPRGALGALEMLGIRLAGMTGECPPRMPRPATIAIFAGDHGVVAEGVTPWPQEVTAQMVANFCAGGAAINVVARQMGAEVVVVDVGVAAPVPPAPQLLDRNVRRATANLASGPSMTHGEARAAIVVGIDVAYSAVATGARCLIPGDMGIGNTTPSAAVIAALTGSAATAVTGRGTGIDEATLVLKTGVVDRAVTRLDSTDPIDVLSEVGGLEIAAIAGFILGGAANRVPIVIDGVISLAGALCAEALAPGTRAWMIAGHRSVEPWASVAIAALGLDPLIDLGLRLGEGSGAALALPLVEVAARLLGEMATFDSAGVTDKG